MNITKDDNKSNVFHLIEFGTLYKTMTEEPSYRLEARKAKGKDNDFKIIKFKNAKELSSYTTVRKKVFEELYYLMPRIKRHEWEVKLNVLMSSMEECETTKKIKSKELPKLHRLFYQYLIHTQAPNQVHVMGGNVYFADNVYYFQALGFRAYLRIAKYNLGKKDLRKQLLLFGCREGEISYTRRDGTSNVIMCWMKDIDDSLLETVKYYQDMWNNDAQILEANKLNKPDTEEPLGWYPEKGTIYD